MASQTHTSSLESKYEHWYEDEEHRTLVEFGCQAKSPCKDFYHVHVSPDQIIFRLWKILPPTRSDYNNYPPVEYRDTFEDFIHDERLHSEIQSKGGDKLLDYLMNIAQGHLDHLPRLPRRALIHMIVMLDLEDITALSCTSQFFRELCNSDELWEKIYERHSETRITEELKKLAKEHTWKKLFFTNKLQLQMHLRRRAQQHQQHQQMRGHAFMTEPME